jgi:hypothetical protein
MFVPQMLRFAALTVRNPPLARGSNASIFLATTTRICVVSNIKCNLGTGGGLQKPLSSPVGSCPARRPEGVNQDQLSCDKLNRKIEEKNIYLLRVLARLPLGLLDSTTGPMGQKTYHGVYEESKEVRRWREE